MEPKTKISAEEGKQEIRIHRTFDLPVELLFKAYVEPEIVQQWMGTKVLKLESKEHGAYQFETSDGQGNVMFKANGVIHEVRSNELISRTFQMENSDLPVQLEFLEFRALSAERSELNMHIVFRSVEARDRLLKLPFAFGLNMAHDRLQETMNTSK